MKKFTSAILVLLLIGMSAAAFYFYQKASAIKEDQANPDAAAQKEVEDIVSRAGKLIILPEGEVPTIATVSDPEKLKDQPFFAKAKVGDKVLLYQNARKAYLYDPVNNKILEVAPISLGTGTSAQGVDTTTESSNTPKEETEQ
ncbi:MAG: hypothetical protein AAB523_01225 [Patescibacteria group bacterium]